MPRTYSRKPLSERFWSKVNVASKDECWPWTAHRDKDGYGTLWDLKDGKDITIRATHVCWMIYYAETVPPGMFVLHKCDNPPCCNPNHLFIGTLQDNADDAKRKGRTATGERNGKRTHPEKIQYGNDHWARRRPELVKRGSERQESKLKEVDVIRIRAILDAPHSRGESNRLANEYGVTRTLIGRIRKRQCWKHIP